MESMTSKPWDGKVDWDDRFWSKVHPEALSGCWLWHGYSLPGRGYGRFKVGGRRGSAVVASRYAFEDAIGPIPPGWCVCHRCDVPACVNPDHLFVGSHKDNAADRDGKGRGRLPALAGDLCPNSKITADVARAIVADRQRGVRVVELAAKYGVRRETVYRIGVETWIAEVGRRAR